MKNNNAYKNLVLFIVLVLKNFLAILIACTVLNVFTKWFRYIIIYLLLFLSLSDLSLTWWRGLGTVRYVAFPLSCRRKRGNAETTMFRRSLLWNMTSLRSILRPRRCWRCSSLTTSLDFNSHNLFHNLADVLKNLTL